MLSVLLKILAVMGILFLILLGVVLFLLLIVLFVPITYRVTAQMEPAGKEALVKANWLFGLLRFQLEYSGEVSWKLQFLWVKRSGMGSHQKTAPAPSKTESKATPEKPKVHVISKLKEIWNNISYYVTILQEDDTKHLIKHCMKVIGNILKSIRPKKIKLNAVIGFESPDITGKIYGLICMLYPYYGDDIHITPDFENKILEGSVFIKGRIYICVLIWNTLRILLDKKLLKVIHKFKNGGKGKNGR